MKALILAAGYGTRLKPYTDHLPKPLFKIAGRTVLDLVIERLSAANCQAIVVNTHHLSDQIHEHITKNKYPIPIFCQHEKEILGTGGAVKNVAKFWDDEPLLIINGDVISDIDLLAVYQTHLGGTHLATLVLHDYEKFNQVWVDDRNIIHKFHGDRPLGCNRIRKLAFTGIHVIGPEILRYIPKGRFHSIIDTYKQLIHSGRTIKGHILRDPYWADIGTPDSFRDANIDVRAPTVFSNVFDHARSPTYKNTPLSGDGSDRGWYRIRQNDRSLVVADHGIQVGLPEKSEMRAFLKIGGHLYQKGIPVPKILDHDSFAGLVFLEDLGDNHLQQAVLKSNNSKSAIKIYCGVIDNWAKMAIKAIDGFDPAWTWQSPAYDRNLILEKECRYFMESFCNDYLSMGVDGERLEEEFNRLADRALENGIFAFIHRDFQSRNIMINNNRPYFIDFQGGRKGPVQYDLASLLIDPYVALPQHVIMDLVTHAVNALNRFRSIQEKTFQSGFNYLAITRNLQILGAFAFLSQIKRKSQFQAYILPALGTLKKSLAFVGKSDFHILASLVDQAFQYLQDRRPCPSYDCKPIHMNYRES